MGEILTLAEIENKYKSEWILVINPELTDGLNIVKGDVVFHSKDRDEVYRKAREIKPEHSAVLYTGEIPKESVVVL